MALLACDVENETGDSKKDDDNEATDNCSNQ